MQEKSLIKLAFIVTIIGLSFLFFYSRGLNLEAIGGVDTIDVAEEVRLKGRVSNIRETEKATFLELEGEKIVQTEIILFPEESVYLKEGDLVEIFGEVEEYKGEKEVIASKIVLK